MYTHYNLINDKLKEKTDDRDEMSKYDFSTTDCEGLTGKKYIQRVLNSFHNHTTKFFNTKQRIYLSDVYIYCKLLNITPNDMLIRDSARIITTDSEFYYYINDDFEENVKKIKHEGATLFKNKKNKNQCMIPIAVHIYTGTALYALVDFTSEENNTVYFVTYYNYEDIKRLGNLNSIKGRYSKHTRTKRIAHKGSVCFSNVFIEYKKLCKKVKDERAQYIINELEEISKFTGYKKLFKSECFSTNTTNKNSD